MLRPNGHFCHRVNGARWVTPLYVAGAVLVVAQATGIYALVSKRADFLFSLVMFFMVAVALVAGGYGAYHELH